MTQSKLCLPSLWLFNLRPFESIIIQDVSMLRNREVHSRAMYTRLSEKALYPTAKFETHKQEISYVCWHEIMALDELSTQISGTFLPFPFSLDY